MADHVNSFEVYSYRVNARFGSRLMVNVTNGTVEVTGPRILVPVYEIWIWTQAILIVLALALLLSSIIFLDWKLTLIALAVLVIHWGIGGIGAGCFWEWANLAAFGSERKGATTRFSVSDIKDVKVGRGWARRGMWFILLPYILPLNQMAEGHCVSFEAPDGIRNRNSVYAFHMLTKEDASNLEKLLEGQKN